MQIIYFVIEECASKLCFVMTNIFFQFNYWLRTKIMSSYNDYQHWPQESTSNTDEDELSSPEIEQDDSDDDTESSTSSTSSSASSSSGSSQSGSDSESTSTADEDEATVSLKTEIALANKTELSLPTGMCEDEVVFKQLFSVNSWICLSDQQKQHLKVNSIYNYICYQLWIIILNFFKRIFSPHFPKMI